MTVVAADADKPDEELASEKAWDDAATKAAVAQLDSVRSTAEKWAGTVTALLGVFSAVALVAGTTSVEDISNGLARWSLVGAVAVAGLLACVSIIAAAWAAQGAAPFSKSDGSDYRSYIIANTRKAVPYLRASRYTGLGAAALVFGIGVATLVLAAIPAGDPTGSSVVVVDRAGVISCGKLDVDSGNVTTVAGQPVVSAAEIIPVTAC